MNPELIQNIVSFASSAPQKIGNAARNHYNQDVFGVTPSSDGSYDLHSIASQEYARTPFSFQDASSGAAIGTAIAPGIGTAIGAGAGALYATGKQIWQSSKKREFEAEKSRAIQAMAYRNSVIDRRRAVIDNMGTRYSRANREFYG